MKTINLEDDVFAQLDELTTQFFSHSDVIRKLLQTRGADMPLAAVATPIRTPEAGSLTALVQSAQYQILNGISKYLAVLGWLYKTHPNTFQKVEDYRKGNRVYFARSREAVEAGGKGIQAKPIPHSPFWTMATLDNRTKRIILTDLLGLFGSQVDEIKKVASTIGDAGRHRGSSPFTKYLTE